MLTALLSPLSCRLEKAGGHGCLSRTPLQAHAWATSTKHNPAHLSEQAELFPARAAAEKRDIYCNQAFNVSRGEAGAMGPPTCGASRLSEVLLWQT